MSDTQRDPNTAAAIILLLGALAELESGESVAVKHTSDDDNPDGRWRITIDLAATPAVEGDGDGDRISRIAPIARARCPRCTNMTIDPTTKTCSHCEFIDD